MDGSLWITTKSIMYAFPNTDSQMLISCFKAVKIFWHTSIAFIILHLHLALWDSTSRTRHPGSKLEGRDICSLRLSTNDWKVSGACKYHVITLFPPNTIHGWQNFKWATWQSASPLFGTGSLIVKALNGDSAKMQHRFARIRLVSSALALLNWINHVAKPYRLAWIKTLLSTDIASIRERREVLSTAWPNLRWPRYLPKEENWRHMTTSQPRPSSRIDKSKGRERNAPKSLRIQSNHGSMKNRGHGIPFRESW